MRNITVVIREVTEWREVGVKLGIKPYKLEEIRLNRMNDVQHCKVHVHACICTLYLCIQYIYVSTMYMYIHREHVYTMYMYIHR